MIKRALNRLQQVIALLLQSLILLIRPMLGFFSHDASVSPCIYPISCTIYAQQALLQMPLHKALVAITKRVLSCNPIYAWYLRHR